MKASFSTIFEQSFPTATEETIKIDRIVIPKIQRSYAQGRKEEGHIRETFLNDIFLHLRTDEEMDLNFIYGSVKELENTNVLELIDGQQRLTTLFLLYWYIGYRELDHDSDRFASLKEMLSRFSYETRVTSSNFCSMLSSFGGQLKPEAPSKSIRRSKWFFKSYELDDTVESMLRMLDTIHDKYENALREDGELNLFDSLDKLQFQILPLGAYGLTEDLYIKMNSRGLPLSSFDNFKAELTEYLRRTEVGNEATIMSNSYDRRLAPRYVVTSTSLDTSWINLFWSEDDQDYGPKYFRFFNLYLGYKYLLDGPVNEKMQNNPIAKYFLERESSASDYKGFSTFRERFDEHPEYFVTLSTVLDELVSHYTKDILPIIAPSWEDSRFTFGIFAASNRKKELAFFALTEYIEAYGKFEPTNFKKWIRVAWNIIENMETDNLTTVSSVARNLSRIIRFTASNRDYSFYEALSLYGQLEMDGTTPRAIREEITKAGRISEDPEWENVFSEAEAHPFLKGTTSFFYSDNLSKDQFHHRFSILSQLLDEKGATPAAKAEGHIFLRSLISQVSYWNEIYGKFLLDRTETKRAFKNFLTNTTNIHDFIHRLTDSENLDIAFNIMREAVQGESRLTDPNQNRVHSFLYKNAALQDWMQEHEAVNLAYYHGNCYIKRQYHTVFKVMLDTKRNVFVQDIVDRYYYDYADPEEREFWKKTHLYYGNELIIKKITTSADVSIHFGDYSTYFIFIKPKGALKKDLFLSHFNLQESDFKYGFIMLSDSYAGDDAYEDICRKYLNPIDKIMDSKD